MLWRLEPFEVWAAQQIAQRRTIENRSNPHIYAGYDNLEPQPLAELNAACCEMAVASRLNRYWGALAWKEEEHKLYSERISDVSDCVEVKRIRYPYSHCKYNDYDLKYDRWVFCCLPLFVDPENIRAVWVDIIGYQKARILHEHHHARRQDHRGQVQYSVRKKYLLKLPLRPQRPQAVFTNNL